MMRRWIENLHIGQLVMMVLLMAAVGVVLFIVVAILLDDSPLAIIAFLVAWVAVVFAFPWIWFGGRKRSLDRVP